MIRDRTLGACALIAFALSIAHPEWLAKALLGVAFISLYVGGAMIVALVVRCCLESLRPWGADIHERRVQYRRRHGLCVTCEYNLTGNVSGVCPECGTIIERSLEAR